MNLRSLCLLLRLIQRINVLGDRLEDVVHLSHLVHEDEDVYLVVTQAHFLEVVQHCLGEHLQVIRGHSFRKLGYPDVVDRPEDEEAGLAFGCVVQTPVS